MSQVILKDKEKECLEALVENRMAAEFGFTKAMKLYQVAEKQLWEKVIRLYPDAVKFEHSDDEKWIVTLCDKPSNRD